MNNELQEDKPKLLQAIDLILAKPENIKDETNQLITKYTKLHPDLSDSDLKEKIVNRIISKYSYFSAFSGGVTALSGIVPGIGTAVAIGGGASADAIASMKFQIEMTMSIATVYGHNILIEEEKRICYLIAGLGAINETTKKAGEAISSKAFIKIVKENLKGATLVAVKEIFKKLGITFTRKALEKGIPFGVGVIIGFSANKALTWYVGIKARDFFCDVERKSIKGAIAKWISYIFKPFAIKKKSSFYFAYKYFKLFFSSYSIKKAFQII